MKRWLLIVLVAAAAGWTSFGARPAVNRGALAALEHRFDRSIQSYQPNDPFHLLGTTRGVYLEDYGVVFTSELNLVAAAVVTPFRPPFTEAQIEELRDKKLQRLDDLKKLMRSMMVDSATSLKTLPENRRVAVGVTLFSFAWENSRGIPRQILMEARRGDLLGFESGKLDAAGLNAAIRVQEF